METYSFTGTLGRDDEAMIDVCLFEDLPFSQDYTVIYQWRAGDILNLLIEEGHLNKEGIDFAKIASVRANRYYAMDIEGLSLERPKAKMITEYTVGVSLLIATGILGGKNIIVEDMDQKMRDIKLKRIL